MEGVETTGGKVLDLDAAAEVERDFARAMAAPPGSDEKAPPKRAEKTAKTTAPADKPRVARRGRPPKADKPVVAGLSRDIRVKGVTGLVQVGATLLAVAGKSTGSKPLSADGVTLAMTAPDWGTAVADVADQDERFARVVDRLCAAGPYAGLISVAIATASQCARNHGLDIPGTMSADELLKAAEEQAEAVPA